MLRDLLEMSCSDWFSLTLTNWKTETEKLTNHCSTDIEMETVCCPSWSMNPSSQAKTVFFHFSIMLRIILVPPCTAQPQKCIHFFKKNQWCCTSVSDLFENALLRRWKERKTASSGIQTQTSLWGVCSAASVLPLSNKTVLKYEDHSGGNEKPAALEAIATIKLDLFKVKPSILFLWKRWNRTSDSSSTRHNVVVLPLVPKSLPWTFNRPHSIF